MQKMHVANSDKPVQIYNLDVIISFGYRFKSKQDSQFRIRANHLLIFLTNTILDYQFQ